MIKQISVGLLEMGSYTDRIWLRFLGGGGETRETKNDRLTFITPACPAGLRRTTVCTFSPLGSSTSVTPTVAYENWFHQRTSPAS